MRVAISGISSRFAADLVAALEQDGRVTQIVGLDRVAPRSLSPKVTFYRRDIRDPAIAEAIRGCDTLVHLAFVFLPPIPPLKEVYAINVEGSRNVFSAAARTGVRKIVYASSVASYGAFPDNPVPITEDHPLRLMTPPFYYNETKLRVERMLDELEQASPDLTITRLRFCTVAGRYPTPVLRRKIFATPSLDVPMQFVWVDDLVQAFLLALERDAPGAFNIAGDNPLSWRELGRITRKRTLALPYRLTLLLARATYGLGLQRQLPPGWLRMARYPVVVDCTRARQVLGWRPRFDTGGAVTEQLKFN